MIDEHVLPIALGQPIGLGDLEALARGEKRAVVAEDARKRIVTARAVVDKLADAGDDAPAVYGVNTGFGALAETRVNAGDIRKLQRNLVLSHCCGVGPNLSIEQVRGMMVLRAQVIAQGHSGVRLEVVDLLVNMLNRGVSPRIPAQGSVGASGDLAPLAHLAATLIGEGEAHFEGQLMPGIDALEQAGLEPIELAAKEGLALINGTQYMASLGALALCQLRRLCTVADIAGAMSLEALKGSKRPFDERLMKVRPHPGQAQTAKNLRILLDNSQIMASHAECAKVQDPYSLRCMPQVHGATRDALNWAREVVRRELNSVTDNPTIVFGEGEPDILSGGNFHGQPLALALDLAAMAAAELANISERRVEQLVNPSLSTGLTPFLAPDSGLCSGFMIAQVASAALVSENKILAHPASVDSIPSSANREDHVSMGSISARKLEQIVTNVTNSLAIELLCAAEGVDQRKPLKPSRGVLAARDIIRQHVAPLTDDRALYKDIAAIGGLIDDDSLRESVEAAIGTLA